MEADQAERGAEGGPEEVPHQRRCDVLQLQDRHGRELLVDALEDVVVEVPGLVPRVIQPRERYRGSELEEVRRGPFERGGGSVWSN